MRRTSTGWETDSTTGVGPPDYEPLNSVIAGTTVPYDYDNAMGASHQDGPREGYALARGYTEMYTSGSQEDTFAYALATPMFDQGQAVPQTDVILTSGSDLDRVAPNAWPLILDEAEAYQVGGSPEGPPLNRLKQVYHENTDANFGLLGGIPDWYFRRKSRYNSTPESQAGLPGPIPNASRPMYNNLPATTNYQTRVVDPNQQAQWDELTSPPADGLTSVVFTPASNASLKEQIL